MCQFHDYPFSRRRFMAFSATTGAGMLSASLSTQDSGSGDTMQQLTFIKPGTLEWREVPKPTIQGPKEAIVRPIAVARCDVDFAIYTGLFPAQGPFAVGHEFNGEVVEVGEDVKNFKVGDEVICSFQIACGECEYCRRGQARSCTAVTRGAMYGFDRGYGGAHSDYVHVPFADYMLIEKPASLDPVSIASISDNVIDGWRTVAPYIEDSIHGDVLVMGGVARSIGLYAAGIAVGLGASRVDYVDTDHDRLAIAESVGANVIEGPAPEQLGPYDITVDTSLSPQALQCALRSVRPEGICTSVGIYLAPGTPLPLGDMYSIGVTFKTGRINSRPNLPKVLDIVLEGKFKPESITTRTASWEDAPEALLDPSAKIIIHRN